MTDDQRLDHLCQIGRLLDRAVDLSDACDRPMLSAHIAQAIHVLDQIVAGERPHPLSEVPLRALPRGRRPSGESG